MNQKTYIAILGGILIVLAALSWMFASLVFSTSSTGGKDQSVREVFSEQAVPSVPSVPEILSCDGMEGKTIPYPEVRYCKDASGVVVDRALWRRIGPATYRIIVESLNPEKDPANIIRVDKMSGAFLKGNVSRESSAGLKEVLWIAQKTDPVTWEIVYDLSCANLDSRQVPRVLEPECSQ